VRIHPLHCDGDTAASRHDAQLPGGGAAVPVETASVLHGPWEVRVHRVGGGAPHAAVREGGYAVADARPPQVETGPGWALARTADGLTSAVVALHGWDEEAAVAREVAANAFGSHSATPYLTRTARHPEGAGAGEGPAGAGEDGEAAGSVHVTLVVLSQDTVDPAALRQAIRCEVDGDRVRIAFPGAAPVEVPRRS
jgi:hypothetical protein